MGLPVAWSDRFTEFFFSPPSLWPAWTTRMRRFRELVDYLGLTPRIVEWFEPVKASVEDLLLVHTREYVERLIEASSAPEPVPLDYGDTYAYPGMLDDLLLVVGAGLSAYKRALGVGFGYTPFGGLHHARRSAAGGFCPANDVAVVNERARRDEGARLTLYIDIDVHHCDGVQEVYWSDPCFIQISLHGYAPGFYPGTGSLSELGGGEARGTKLNLPLPPGTCDDAWLHGLHRLLRGVVEELEAAGAEVDLVLAQMGVDAHHADRLGVLSLTTRAYLDAGREIAAAARRLGAPLVGFGGGGYGPLAHKCMVAELLGVAEVAGVDVPRHAVEEVVEEPSSCGGLSSVEEAVNYLLAEFSSAAPRVARICSGAPRA